MISARDLYFRIISCFIIALAIIEVAVVLLSKFSNELLHL